MRRNLDFIELFEHDHLRQEQEFERLGGTRMQRVNVRVVAATNRDLTSMVAAQQFRADLYYRLSVFPLAMPPLRERAEDIPPLVEAFVRRYAQRMNKPVRTIPAEVLDAMTRYPWPGNVRELQNFIERSVILSSGTVLRPPLAELRRAAAGVPVRGHTLAEAEREHIRQALKEAGWVIGGPRGAAQRLGVKRTTLLAKMRRLGGLTRPAA